MVFGNIGCDVKGSDSYGTELASNQQGREAATMFNLFTYDMQENVSGGLILYRGTDASPVQ